MRAKRRRHSASIKFRAVLDVLRGEESVAQVAQVYQVHPSVLKQWKDRFLDLGAGLFEREFPEPADLQAPRELADAQALGVEDQRNESGHVPDLQATPLSALLRRQAD